MPSMTLTCCLCNLPMQKSKTSKPQGEAAHNKCRTAEGVFLKHGANAYKRGCRCDECKAAIAAKMREYVAGRTARDGYSPTVAIKRRKRGVDPAASWDCFICKKPLEKASRGGLRPMHKACRSSAPEWLRKGLSNPKVTGFQKRIEKAAAGTNGGSRVFVAGGCAWCGEYFVAAAGVYCTDKCKASAKFKRRSSGKSFTVSPRVRHSIYARDRWTCQICSHPVDMDAKHPSHWAPTLDHIEPQSAALIPDHSPSNLRLAHSWCNSARGDGSNMAKDVLIARATAMHLEAA